MKLDKLILIVAIGAIMTACTSHNDNDHPEPIYMDSVDGISLQPIESISYYVGPLSHEWFVNFANGEEGIIGYNKSLPNPWKFRARFDTTRAFPLTGHSGAFIERYGIAEEDLVKIMDYINANGIVLLCGPSYLRWEEEYAYAIYEYHDDTLNERLVLFDAIDDSIRFIYDIERTPSKKNSRNNPSNIKTIEDFENLVESSTHSSGIRGYARRTNRNTDCIEYIYDETHITTFCFSADTTQCLYIHSDDNHFLNSFQPLTRKK